MRSHLPKSSACWCWAVMKWNEMTDGRAINIAHCCVIEYKYRSRINIPETQTQYRLIRTFAGIPCPFATLAIAEFLSFANQLQILPMAKPYREPRMSRSNKWDHGTTDNTSYYRLDVFFHWARNRYKKLSMHLILLDESAPVSNIAIWDRNINALCFGGGWRQASMSCFCGWKLCPLRRLIFAYVHNFSSMLSSVFVSIRTQ